TRPAPQSTSLPTRRSSDLRGIRSPRRGCCQSPRRGRGWSRSFRCLLGSGGVVGGSAVGGGGVGRHLGGGGRLGGLVLGEGERGLAHPRTFVPGPLAMGQTLRVAG